MNTKLQRIADIAKSNPDEKFSALIHHINKDMLIMCHKELKTNKATGVDGITKSQYEVNLEENIEGLLKRMKQMSYKPQPVRRVYIPKPGSTKKRPLGIPSYEDKLVQLAINKVITAIYEQDFLACSFGFRPDRGCHDALKVLDGYLSRRNINYVVDADIRGFFEHVDHEWLMKFLGHRISDKNLLRYIKRFLKSGVMENGRFEKNYEGTPQGGIISPTLANIYLHYVLDLWFEKRIKKQCKGEAYMVRYADDYVCCFEYEEEAKAFYRALKERLAQFNLELATEKSKILYFGKQAYLERNVGNE
ncbi:MAG: group II intron reverse transcriptase/maturase [Cellulosilyticaceae bacterium]